jgi:hypothetical protein
MMSGARITFLAPNGWLIYAGMETGLKETGLV